MNYFDFFYRAFLSFLELDTLWSPFKVRVYICRQGKFISSIVVIQSALQRKIFKKNSNHKKSFIRNTKNTKKKEMKRHTLVKMK